MKVAIIGGGPRGLWAAEELMGRARERGARIDLSVFNDGPISGPGAFQQDLPARWLLNVPAHIISSQLGTFNDWRGADDMYPPRRDVGRFLTASWDALERHLPAGCALTFTDTEVRSIARSGEKFEVEGSLFDEVLVTTGHATRWPGQLTSAEVGGLPVISPAYPATQLDRISSEDVVLVRGAALTFIDVVRYAPAKAFYPVTRGGRFMEVKAQPSAQAQAQVDDLVTQAGPRFLAAADFDALRAALAGLAASIVQALGGSAAAGEIDAVLAGTDGTGDAVSDLRRSYAAATGAQPWTAATAVGYAFRAAYPYIIERSSFGGRDSLGGAQFGALTRTLERVAFGPPPETAGEVLELIDAGRIRTDVLGSGHDDLADVAARVGATCVVDAVIAPSGVVPGTLAGALVEAGLGHVHPETGSLIVESDGTVAGTPHLAAAGRVSEGWILGHDTLRRGAHEVIPSWARRVTREAMDTPDRVHGMPPLEARLEPWSRDLVADFSECRRLVNTFGSPVNVLHPAPMLANVDELVTAGDECGVEVKVFFARKSNKALTFVDTVRDAGHGVDVASENELRQVIARGVPGERIILSAAVKPDGLLDLAIANRVVISADNREEFARIHRIAGSRTAFVAPRLAPDPNLLPPTRFGERSAVWSSFLTPGPDNVAIVGVHAHLHGYAASDRRVALRECLSLIDALRAAGHDPQFIDLGGGVPMSYLDSAQQWEGYQSAIAAQRAGYADPFTWKSDPLTTTYPYYQRPTRGAWLRDVLGDGFAEELTRRGLRLHLEPGRSLLDGCGLILADVAFVKTRSDGLSLVGLHMNRTQCRTTSDDYLVDPILVASSSEGEECEAFLVGAYCIEDELILRRKVRFPRGVSAGDIVAIPNAAGYFMHILESASHQIPLAKNVVFPECVLDDIDLH
ncbi:Diaminopimelate decarboxylase [Corynebacterium capitovis DSM 44611]|nr:Diaminopimelate decarboxylase [Corynebacterium capitovis DSM 44611]